MSRKGKKVDRRLVAVAALSVVLVVLIAVTVWMETNRKSADFESGAALATTPTQTTLMQTTPVQTTPVQTTLEQTTPIQTTPIQTTPVQTTPAQTTPVQTTQQPASTPSAPATTPKPADPDAEITTPYVTLYYPGQYKEYLHTEVLDDGFEVTVLFYSTVGGHRDALMFTLFFGGAEGEPLGSFQTGQDFAVDVTVEMSGYIPNEAWSTEDADVFYAMQENMNYVINRLENTSGFTPAEH